MEATLELALCFHYAVTRNDSGLSAATSRLYDLTRSGYYAYYTDIAHFMAGLPLPTGHVSPPQWLDGETSVRGRWQALVDARRDRLESGTGAV